PTGSPPGSPSGSGRTWSRRPGGRSPTGSPTVCAATTWTDADRRPDRAARARGRGRTRPATVGPMAELHDLSALEQGALVATGGTSPVELVEHYAARADEVGAFVTTTYDQALDRARRLADAGR